MTNRLSKFSADIVRFNEMYKLPVGKAPTLNVGVKASERLANFKNILAEELNEIDEIIPIVLQAEQPGTVEEVASAQLAALTALADLLGDIQVYCASEMAKFGLPRDLVLKIIMESNFSKLGADGKPIYDERGKVQKGPNYWKPEPELSNMLEGYINLQSALSAGATERPADK